MEMVSSLCRFSYSPHQLLFCYFRRLANCGNLLSFGPSSSSSRRRKERHWTLDCQPTRAPKQSRVSSFVLQVGNGQPNMNSARGRDQRSGDLPEAAVGVKARMAGLDHRRERAKRRTKTMVAFGDASKGAVGCIG